MLVVAVAMMVGATGGPCQPLYFEKYPGVEVREALFEGIALSVGQCTSLERMTKELHRKMRSMNDEWASRPREERRQKVREMFYEHAVEAATIATETQAERVKINLKGLKKRLVEELVQRPDTVAGSVWGSGAVPTRR